MLSPSAALTSAQLGAQPAPHVPEYLIAPELVIAGLGLAALAIVALCLAFEGGRGFERGQREREQREAARRARNAAPPAGVRP